MGKGSKWYKIWMKYEIYQYADSMLKHLPKDALKTIQKTHLYSKQAMYYADPNIDRRNQYKHNWSECCTNSSVENQSC